MNVLAAAALFAHLVVAGGDPAASRPPVSDAELERGITCEKSAHCVVARALVDHLLDDSETLAESARIVPSWRGGKPDGFRLFAIRPGSVWSRLGFNNADTIQKINGLDLTSPASAVEIYTKLSNATKVAVRIVRRGQPLTLPFEIR